MSRQLILRCLVPNACVGGVIGRGGSTVKSTMEKSGLILFELSDLFLEPGARIVVSKQVLPQSTERVVEICGNGNEM